MDCCKIRYSQLGDLTGDSFKEYQNFNFSNMHYLGQIARNLQAKLQESLVIDFPEHATAANPLASLFREIKPDVSDPKSFRREVKEITNRILGMATAGGIDVALAEKQSLLTSTGTAPRDTSNDPDVFANGVAEEKPQGEDQTTTEFLSLEKSLNKQYGKSKYNIRYKPIVTKQPSDVKATFKLLTNDSEFASNIQVYVIDKNSNKVADLEPSVK